MNFRTKKLFISALIVGTTLLLPAIVFAAGEVPTIGLFANVFGEATLAQIIIRLVQLFLALLGFIALALLLYAGFTWMTAAGDPAKVEKAKRIIVQVIIGLVIIFSSFAITAFIYDRFGPAGTDGEGGDGGGGGGGGFEYWTNYPPEITYVDPAMDIAGNTDRSRLTAIQTNDDIANGAPGNYISIIGRYFGPVRGKIFFVKKSDQSRIEAQLAPCANAWSGNLIIALVPAGLDQTGVSKEAEVAGANPLRNYDIVVEKLSTGAETLASNLWGFQVNKVERPGICSMTPSHGVYPATTTLDGFKFPTASPQNIVWSVSPNFTTSTGSNWSVSSAIDVVPQDLAGRALVRVFNGESYSNAFLFMISQGQVNDPCGYDTNSCREDITTCTGNANLACQFCSTDQTKPNYQVGCNEAKNCTCQNKEESCVYSANIADNAKRACSTGGCEGFEYCSEKSVWSQACQLTDETCVPFLGNSAGTASFSWAFKAQKKPAPGLSCKSDVWLDDTCDVNGCLDATLGCDMSATTEEWVELYNPTNNPIDLAGWRVVFKDNSFAGAENIFSDLAGQSIPARGYLVVANSSVKLPSAGASISLSNAVDKIDSVAYGVDKLSPAFSPASIGRKVDGSDTGNASDFIYYPNSSAGLANNQKNSSSTDHLVINEISLRHDSCTCVPKSQLCVAGAVDTANCPTVGQCKQVRSCLASGHFGSCVQADPNCLPYPLIPASTISAYSWKFGANGKVTDNGPMIVSACDGSIDCSKNRLPSPSPWDKWTKSALASIENEQACLNSVIYARFTKMMDASTLTVGNIKLYEYSISAGAWQDKTGDYVGSIEPQLSTGEAGADSFVINLKQLLQADKNYRVYVSKKVRDELGRNLVDDPSDAGVNQALCSQNSASGLPSETTEPGVCWSFKTRPASSKDLICQIGCVNCGPSQYFNRYYGQEQMHTASPISLDNSCIMLNNRDYAWDWSENEQALGGNNWFTQTDIAKAYSWLTDPLAGNSGIASQPAQTIASGHGTTTAYQESQWRTNSDYSSWFSADDTDYFRIKGQVEATGHFGVCSAHNNFTDPIVVENQYCTKSDDLSKQILQSPSPWKGQTDACINAAIFVLFSRNMQNSSLLGSVKSDGSFPIKNFEIYKCGSAGAATSSDFSSRASGCTLLNNNDWTANVFNYTHENITFKELFDAPLSAYGSLIPEGVQIMPPNKERLATDSWYKIIIKGGYNGVRGAEASANEVAEGILQVPSANARLINGAETWYFWYFKTGPTDCPIDQVAVLPQMKFMPTVGETQAYLADPYAANCNHLNPNIYVWKWDSLINPFVDRCTSANPSSGDYVATVCAVNDQNCLNPTEPALAKVKAFSQSEGKTKISATAVQGTCAENKWGAGDLQVGYGSFRVVSQNNTDCLNADLNLAFSQDAKNTSLYQANKKDKNILLYECGDKECLSLAGLKEININYPQGLPNNPNPIFASNAYLAPQEDLLAGKSYRVVVKGGSAGVRSAVDSELTGLNYQSTPNNGGEACDPALYPWRAGDPEAGLCSSSCKLTGNLCAVGSKQCNPLKDSLCNNDCQKTGNTNVLASCGNGAVESGEDCDDGNIASGDGCSARCLWEGSNNKYNAICGNARLEKGEQCDDGNNIAGDGCSAKCLYEADYASSATSQYKNFACGTLNKPTTTATVAGKSVAVKIACSTPGSNNCNASCLNLGSEAKAPICGNSKLEAGEQCDDGVGNNKAGNRCQADCLLAGSQGAMCGDGKLQNGQFDSYSWTFALGAGTKVCKAINFDLNPCPNGVWSVTADASVDKLGIKFYKGGPDKVSNECISDAQMSKLSFWRRIFNELVKIIKSFFGFRTAIAADWWCPISSEAEGSFILADLAKIRLGNYKRDIAIDSALKNTEVIAYPDDADNFKLNFIRNQNWSLSTEYKAVVMYERQGVNGTSTASVTTFNKTCQMASVKFDVWPRGAVKNSDSFFCASDPATGKPDECGRFSSDLYDDDMSAPWTQNYPGNGYNLGNNGGTEASKLADYKNGNQHLYRVWPLDSNRYVLRGTEFAPEINNLGSAKTVSANIESTSYKGDFWATSGFNPGRSMFNVAISDAIDPSAGAKAGTLPIYTFFCSNPWPDAQNFPFIDGSANCKAGTGSCLNTNFGTYYCRDAGTDKVCVRGDADKLGQACSSNNSCWRTLPADAEGSCQLYVADDLRSIANYDAATATFGEGTAVVMGSSGDTCASLPSTFATKVAYFNSNDNKAYLWGNDNNIYKGSYTLGWEKADKGDWQKKGLPGNFSPVVGYNYLGKMYLWDNAGRYFVWDGVEWKTASKGNLPANFRPTVGYAYRDSSGVDRRIELWDASGLYKVSTDAGASWHDGVKPSAPANFKAVVGYSGSNNNVQIWDKAGNYKVSDASGANWQDGQKTNLPAGFKPNLGFYDGSNVIIKQNNKAYLGGQTAVWTAVATTDKLCDNKLKEFLFANSQESTSSDAIGLRMYNNNNHYSPEQWYKARFNPNLQGNLAKLTIDGYSAAQEGRTTYVNAADFSNDRNSVYTDIYLMSYNQGADKITENIYGQMVSNWFFNAGTQAQGGLEYGEALGYCSLGQATADNMCFTDLDCVKRNAGFCTVKAGDVMHNADKAKITRDTQRLADIQDIYSTFAGYYNKLRCSNDFPRVCKTNADCFGDGVCGNFYPNLRAGTYITGKTFSAWPSWQDNLAKELGAKLPVDPINRFWAWDGTKSVDCADPYNAQTCWDQTNKQMFCNLSYDSAVYAYYGVKSGVSARVLIKGEEYPNGSNWQPAWQYVNNLGFNPFDGYNSLINNQQFCTAISDTCGDGVCGNGETCSTCLLDCGCGLKQACLKNNNNAWSCGPLKSCGDGQKQPAEECDPKISGQPAGSCTDNCQLVDGYRADPLGKITPICGDGVKTPVEECEFVGGAPTCGKQTAGGLLCCTDQCKLADWYKSVNKNPVCGDGLRTDQEECDCGTAGKVIFGQGSQKNNPFACPFLNDVAGTTYTKTPENLPDFTFCDTVCRRHDKGDYLYCGDNIWADPKLISGSAEACDMGANNGVTPSQGCTKECACDTANGFTCSGGKPTLCGNSKIDVGEACDLGAGNGANGCTKECACDTVGGYDCSSGKPTKCGNGEVDKDVGEVCDWKNDANCNDTCTGPKDLICTDPNAQLNPAKTDCVCKTGFILINGLCQPVSPPAICKTLISEPISAFSLTTSNRFINTIAMPGCGSSNSTLYLNTILSQTNIGTFNELDVVFVLDYSLSMSDLNFATIKTQTKGAIDSLYAKYPTAKIGLVGYAGGVVFFMPLKAINDKQTLISAMDTNRKIGTNLKLALTEADALLFEGNGVNKMIMIFGDGQCNNVGGYSCTGDNNDPTGIIDEIKSKGGKIFGAAFTANATGGKNMNIWSSNNGIGSCDQGFCFMSTDITSLFVKFNQSIIPDSHRITLRVDLTQNYTGENTTQYITGPFIRGSNSNSLVLNPNYCSASGDSRKLQITGNSLGLKSGDSAAIYRIDGSGFIQYWKDVPCGTGQSQSANAQVAGVYEAKAPDKPDGFWQTIRNLLWQFTPLNILQSLVK